MASPGCASGSFQAGQGQYDGDEGGVKVADAGGAVEAARSASRNIRRIGFSPIPVLTNRGDAQGGSTTLRPALQGRRDSRTDPRLKRGTEVKAPGGIRGINGLTGFRFSPSDGT